jgi:hypothetical protein
MAHTGAGTATVTRALAENINEAALPQDKINPKSLQNKVSYAENDKSIILNSDNKPEPKQEPSLQNNLWIK